jgi:hypothetical protein
LLTWFAPVLVLKIIFFPGGKKNNPACKTLASKRLFKFSPNAAHTAFFEPLRVSLKL